MQQGTDYIGVGIGAMILNRDGKFFLNLRGKNAKNERGKWEFPGGGMEFGETMEDTIKREIQEEFGFVIEPVIQLPAVNHLLSDEKQHWMAVAFLCKVVSGESKILEPDKSEKIGWFTVQEIEQLALTIPSQSHMKYIKKQYPQEPPNLYYLSRA